MLETSSTTKTWTPSKRQADFLSVPDSVFECLGGGAAGGGKSELLLMLPIARQFHLNPRFKGLLLRRTYPELESEMILRSHEFYGPCGAQYNDTKKRWTFPEGAVIQFGHCENEKDVKKYDTSQYNYVGFDELTSFTEYQYIYISFTRVRSSDNRLPSIVRAGTNPGNLGHTWVYNRFVKPCESGYKIIRRKVILTIEGAKINRETDAIYIPFKATDNPYLMQSDPNYVIRLASLPPAERAAKLEGRWDSFEGQAFEDFSESKHVVTPFPIPDYWPRIMAVDWGYAAMMCAGLYAVNPVPTDQHPAKIYKIDEHTCVKTKVDVWATDLRRKWNTNIESIASVVLDPSAWQERGQGLIADLFALHFGTRAARANNDRVGGKILLQEYLRTTPRPPRYIPKEGFDLELSLRIKRLYGDNAYNEYKAMFTPEEPEGFLPKLQFFEGCKETISCLPKCSYAPNSKGKPNEDVAEFNGDDPYDETRYGLYECIRFLEEGKQEHALATKVATVCSDLERTGDMTSFYRRMDKIEGDKEAVLQGVRRRRRR